MAESIKMTPSLPLLNALYVALRDAIRLGNRSLRSWVGPNGAHLILSEFVQVMSHTMIRSLLVHLVDHVVGRCTEKQVIYVDAVRRVALVTAEQPRPNRTVDEFPCNSMDGVRGVFMGLTNLSIATTVFPSSPNTATRWGQKVTVAMQELGERFSLETKRCWHGVLTETKEGSPVSPAVTGRWLHPLVPANSIIH